LVERGGRGRVEMVVRRAKRARKERETCLRRVIQSYQREAVLEFGSKLHVSYRMDK
jgi:hypothetical protein